jgi:hypothetical protein
MPIPTGTRRARCRGVFCPGLPVVSRACGDAPANLALRGAGETGTIRRGRPGMPAYGTDRIGDAQLADLQAYMRTFAGSRGRGGGKNASKVEAMEPDNATRAQRIRQCPRGGDRHDHLTRARDRLVRCCARPVIPGSGISSGTECRARVGQVSLLAGLENW